MKTCLVTLMISAGSLLFSSMLAMAAETAALDASEFEKSILQLSATRAIPDIESPWNIQNIDVSGFIGVYIGENRILAPASLVSRAVFIQGQKMEEVTKIPLKVVFADHEANLAILSPTEGSLSDLKALPLGPDLPSNSDLWMVGIENERQLVRASVRVLEVGLREVVSGGQQLLSYILAGQNKATCRGEPLIRQGKLVGMCLGATDNQPWGHSASTIRHFLQDRLDEKEYRGFPLLGLGLGTVKSPYLKLELKWPAGVKGLRVSEVYETSAFAGDVQAGDILTAIDNEALDNRGFVRHPIWGPVPARHYVSQKYAGEKVVLHLLRAGQAIQVAKPLRRYLGQDFRFPGMTFEGDLSHLIIGGLVFREFGVDYLASYGRDWYRNAPTELLHMFQFLNRPILSRTRSILLTHVLPDPFNQGYDKESVIILGRVNGAVVANLDELRLTARNRAIEKGGQKYMVFEFDRGVQMILPVDGLKDAQSRIARAYSVTSSKSFLATE